MINLTALHPFLKTKTDSNKLILTLEKLSNALFKEGVSVSDVLSKEISFDLKSGIEKTARDEKINMEDKKDFEPFLRKIQQEISSLPVIHIMLSIIPKDETIQTIHQWFYENYKRSVLLDVSVDDTLIGGAVLSFNGRANDYSLKMKIAQMA